MAHERAEGRGGASRPGPKRPPAGGRTAGGRSAQRGTDAATAAEAERRTEPPQHATPSAGLRPGSEPGRVTTRRDHRSRGGTPRGARGYPFTAPVFIPFTR
jgi:hypothetical protein